MIVSNYERVIKNARENKLNKRFGNTSIEHARVLVKEIVLDANNSIKILSDNFNNYFYSKILSSIENFLNKNKSNIVEIIVIDNEEKNELLESLKSKYKKQVKIYKIPKEDYPIDSDSKERVNFIINDNYAYRYEYSDKDLKNGIVKAIANFNNEEENKLLQDTFDKVKKRTDG